jgi:hypothetical protein
MREHDQQSATLLSDEPLTLTHEETVAEVTIDTAKSDHFTGQVIRDGETIVYASLPATKLFVKTQQWTRAEPFAI